MKPIKDVIQQSSVYPVFVMSCASAQDTQLTAEELGVLAYVLSMKGLATNDAIAHRFNLPASDVQAIVKSLHSVGALNNG